MLRRRNGIITNIKKAGKRKHNKQQTKKQKKNTQKQTKKDHHNKKNKKKTETGIRRRGRIRRDRRGINKKRDNTIETNKAAYEDGQH